MTVCTSDACHKCVKIYVSVILRTNLFYLPFVHTHWQCAVTQSVKAGLLGREALAGRISSVCQTCLDLKSLEVLVGLLYVRMGIQLTVIHLVSVLMCYTSLILIYLAAKTSAG